MYSVQQHLIFGVCVTAGLIFRVFVLLIVNLPVRVNSVTLYNVEPVVNVFTNMKMQ